MAKYETMVILDPSPEAQEIEKEIEKITSFIEAGEGSMHLVEKVGRRRLAYEIQGNSDGYYAVFYYDADPSQIGPLQRSLKLNESVLRYLVLRKDKHPDGPMMSGPAVADESSGYGGRHGGRPSYGHSSPRRYDDDRPAPPRRYDDDRPAPPRKPVETSEETPAEKPIESAPAEQEQAKPAEEASAAEAPVEAPASDSAEETKSE